MNLENGSPTYKILLCEKFKRSIKLLKKSYKGQRSQQEFIDYVGVLITNLTQSPKPESSRLEPIPKGTALPEPYEFRKLTFPVPGKAGASGEGRLMYLLDEENLKIVLVWTYTHEEFKKRPPDQELKQLLQNLMDDDIDE
jgi:hypothetical protein